MAATLLLNSWIRRTEVHFESLRQPWLPFYFTFSFFLGASRGFFLDLLIWNFLEGWLAFRIQCTDGLEKTAEVEDD